MRYFYKHFDVTEGIKTSGNSGRNLFQITESQFKDSIKFQKLAFIEIIKNYDNFGIHYIARVNLTSPNDYPGGYVLTSDNNQVLIYENIDQLLSILNNLGYNPHKADLSIVEVFSGF